MGQLLGSHVCHTGHWSWNRLSGHGLGLLVGGNGKEQIERQVETAFTNLYVQNVSSFYRQEYFQNIISKRIAFFDDENSPGTLTSRLSTDSTQLQQLLGTEMGMAIVGILSIVGSVIHLFRVWLEALPRWHSRSNACCPHRWILSSEARERL